MSDTPFHDSAGTPAIPTFTSLPALLWLVRRGEHDDIPVMAIGTEAFDDSPERWYVTSHGTRIHLAEVHAFASEGQALRYCTRRALRRGGERPPKHRIPLPDRPERGAQRPEHGDVLPVGKVSQRAN